jgi:hypothetical protein
MGSLMISSSLPLRSVVDISRPDGREAINRILMNEYFLGI